VNINSGVEEALIESRELQQMTIKNDLIYMVIKTGYDKFELRIFNLKGKLETSYSLIGFDVDYLLAFNVNNNKIDFLLNKKSLEFKKF
jgi:hypothetical protein